MSGERGQSTVELTALLPLLALLAIGTHALLAAHGAHEQAGTAAEAGAIALLQDRDARAAARSALPEDARATVAVDGRRVTVTVRPALPVLSSELTARATADAGPR